MIDQSGNDRKRFGGLSGKRSFPRRCYDIGAALPEGHPKFLTGDYTKLADSLGVHAENITPSGQIGLALERAKRISATGRPVVLEIITREEPVFSNYY